jgi:hypothetical protein
VARPWYISFFPNVNCCIYGNEDMHALLFNIKLGRFQDIDGKLRVLSYMVVAPWIVAYKPLA